MSAHLPAAIEALHRTQSDRDFLLISASISRKLHRELSDESVRYSVQLESSLNMEND